MGSPIRGDPVLGKTRWRRFAAAALVPFSGLALVVGLLASGAMALPVVISGTTFTVTADRLTVPPAAQGPGAYVQYGTVDPSVGGSPAAVAVTELRGAQLSNLTQTICLPTGLPSPIDHAKMVVKANPATASNMVVDATSLTGSATFTNFQMGVPVTSARTGTPTIGQTADNVTIDNLNQSAVYTSAGTFSLSDLSLGVSFGC